MRTLRRADTISRDKALMKAIHHESSKAHQTITRMMQRTAPTRSAKAS